MWNHSAMTFAEWVVKMGGPKGVAKRCRDAGYPVSRSYLANVVAQRRNLTPRAVSRLRASFPRVSGKAWMAWLVPTAVTAEGTTHAQ